MTHKPGAQHLYDEAVKHGRSGYFVPVANAVTISGDPSDSPTLETMKNEYDALQQELEAVVRYALVLEDVYGDLRGAYPLASDVLDRYEQGAHS